MDTRTVAPKPSLPGLQWKCSSCGVTFDVYKPSKLGDSDPCTECKDGTTFVVKIEDHRVKRTVVCNRPHLVVVIDEVKLWAPEGKDNGYRWYVRVNDKTVGDYGTFSRAQKRAEKEAT